MTDYNDRPHADKNINDLTDAQLLEAWEWARSHGPDATIDAIIPELVDRWTDSVDVPTEEEPPHSHLTPTEMTDAQLEDAYEWARREHTPDRYLKKFSAEIASRWNDSTNGNSTNEYVEPLSGDIISQEWIDIWTYRIIVRDDDGTHYEEIYTFDAQYEFE